MIGVPDQAGKAAWAACTAASRAAASLRGTVEIIAPFKGLNTSIVAAEALATEWPATKLRMAGYFNV